MRRLGRTFARTEPMRLSGSASRRRPSAASQRHIARLQALASWTRRLADLLACGAAQTMQDALARAALTSPAPTNIDTALLSAASSGSSTDPGASSSVTTQSSHRRPRTGHVMQSAIIAGPPQYVSVHLARGLSWDCTGETSWPRRVTTLGRGSDSPPGPSPRPHMEAPLAARLASIDARVPRIFAPGAIGAGVGLLLVGTLLGTAVPVGR